MKTPYYMRIIIAADLFANVVLGGRFGETISARVGLRHRWYDVAVADVLNWIQKRHTTLAKQHDEQRDIEALRDLEGMNEK